MSIPLDLLAYVCNRDDREARRLCERYAGRVADVVAGRRRWVFTRDENTAKLAKELGLKVHEVVWYDEKGWWVGRGEYSVDDVVEAALYGAALVYRAVSVLDSTAKPGPLAAAGSRYREPPAPPITPYGIAAPQPVLYVYPLSLVEACILAMLRLPAVIIAPMDGIAATGAHLVAEMSVKRDWGRNVELTLHELRLALDNLVVDRRGVTMETLMGELHKIAARLRSQLGSDYAVYIAGNAVDVIHVVLFDALTTPTGNPKTRKCRVGDTEFDAKKIAETLARHIQAAAGKG